MNATKSRQLLGPVRQLGYVVADVEASALAWADRFGIGPWRIRPALAFDECRYRGESIDIEVAIASSYSNGIELELIAQINGPPSMYSDFLADAPGAQHVCFYPSDYDAAYEFLRDSGMRDLLEGAIRGTKFAYLDDGDGQVIEIADVGPDGIAVRAERARAAPNWNGQDPLRY